MHLELSIGGKLNAGKLIFKFSVGIRTDRELIIVVICPVVHRADEVIIGRNADRIIVAAGAADDPSRAIGDSGSDVACLLCRG